MAVPKRMGRRGFLGVSLCLAWVDWMVVTVSDLVCCLSNHHSRHSIHIPRLLTTVCVSRHLSVFTLLFVHSRSPVILAASPVVPCAPALHSRARGTLSSRSTRVILIPRHPPASRLHRGPFRPPLPGTPKNPTPAIPSSAPRSVRLWLSASAQASAEPLASWLAASTDTAAFASKLYCSILSAPLPTPLGSRLSVHLVRHSTRISWGRSRIFHLPIPITHAVSAIRLAQPSWSSKARRTNKTQANSILDNTSTTRPQPMTALLPGPSATNHHIHD
ncbi:hypothetical protein B0J13DRAFT_523124 [Dactylonectria estremocensis]|uniref:Uncharacterized protein n=1 Tax=Dactylonectria estremocensis TaxID=1079267 RepID=A0A9P9F0V7_9HYPO|nr:hypothetical protein B0J13DRAFT_523124 [Dactylonectria estremocensis]